MIDNIEKNMLSAVEYVEQAKQETKQAVVYQKSARRVRCSLFFLLFHLGFSANNFLLFNKHLTNRSILFYLSLGAP